ncbi:MAG TPA: 2OG-Fe(II) oxygenase [Allosphingosinicella sp.]|nr:2OG-Fe(II) oxygenase [Allosphingosinicella sp.]
MSFLVPAQIDGYLAFDETLCRTAGRSLAERYRTAFPFPHVVIDDFLPRDILSRVARTFPESEGRRHFDRDQERLKYRFAPDESRSAIVRNLLAEMNGQAFLCFLEEMTGIAGLISDPYFTGGGLHETKRGGHLGVHADFNVHERMKIRRRLNVLVYLNDEWPEDYGGDLELWNRRMERCEVTVRPEMGRAVVFSTELDSFHGHPDPLRCPPDRSRRSIATYYYTAIEEGLASVGRRTTNFQARPGTSDRPDWATRKSHFITDWVPPALLRSAGLAKRRLTDNSVLRRLAGKRLR